MARPRCDPFDAAAILAALASGKTTPLRAYEDYACEAARPYARSTFELIMRRVQGGDPGMSPAPLETEAEADTRRAAYWAARLKVKASIVTTCADNASLRVKGGSLIVFDGERSLKYAAGGKHPAAIVMAGWGGLVSIEAMRFCASHRIAIVALDWMRDLLTVMTPAPKASAAILRAQAAADPAWIAKAVVHMKIANAARVGALPSGKAREFMHAVEAAVSVQDAMTIEAQAGRVSWPGAPTLRWQDGKRIPYVWKQPWLGRTRIDMRVKRYATHPINAMLNVVFAVTGARLAAYLVAEGAQPAIGFLHADKPGRWSLAWDAIEPMRPSIEASVFDFIAANRFSAADFMVVRGGRGSIRLADNLLSRPCRRMRSLTRGPEGRLCPDGRSCPRCAGAPLPCAEAPRSAHPEAVGLTPLFALAHAATSVSTKT